MKKFYLFLLAMAVVSCGNKTNSNSNDNDSIASDTLVEDDNTEESIFGAPKVTDFSMFKFGMTKQEVEDVISKLREKYGPFVSVNNLQFEIDWESTEFTNGKLSNIVFTATSPEEFYPDNKTGEWQCITTYSDINEWSQMLEQSEYIGKSLMKSFGGKITSNDGDGVFAFQNGNVSGTVSLDTNLIEEKRENKSADIMDAENMYVDVYNVIYTVSLSKH